jgi:hypothetical protein
VQIYVVVHGYSSSVPGAPWASVFAEVSWILRSRSTKDCLQFVGNEALRLLQWVTCLFCVSYTHEYAEATNTQIIVIIVTGETVPLSHWGWPDNEELAVIWARGEQVKLVAFRRWAMETCRAGMRWDVGHEHEKQGEDMTILREQVDRRCKFWIEQERHRFSELKGETTNTKLSFFLADVDTTKENRNSFSVLNIYRDKLRHSAAKSRLLSSKREISILLLSLPIAHRFRDAIKLKSKFLPLYLLIILNTLLPYIFVPFIFSRSVWICYSDLTADQSRNSGAGETLLISNGCVILRNG